MTDRAPGNPASGRSLAWVRSGLLGGALAGTFDAVSSIVGGIGGLSAAKAVRLIVLSGSLMAAVAVRAPLSDRRPWAPGPTPAYS